MENKVNKYFEIVESQSVTNLNVLIFQRFYYEVLHLCNHRFPE